MPNAWVRRSWSMRYGRCPSSAILYSPQDRKSASSCGSWPAEAQKLTSSTGYRGQTIIFTNSRKNCYNLAQSIPGAAAYHAGLQYPERKRIEELFGQGKIHTVVTTAALAAGVDFPASQVVFESLAMGIKWLNVHEFNQMLGRAGRPGYHDKGLVYILAEPGRKFSSARGESEDEMALALLHGANGGCGTGVFRGAAAGGGSGQCRGCAFQSRSWRSCTT